MTKIEVIIIGIIDINVHHIKFEVVNQFFFKLNFVVVCLTYVGQHQCDHFVVINNFGNPLKKKKERKAELLTFDVIPVLMAIGF